MKNHKGSLRRLYDEDRFIFSFVLNKIITKRDFLLLCVFFHQRRSYVEFLRLS